MVTIYYLFTIIFIWAEFLWVLSPIDQAKDAKRLDELTKENKGKKYSDFPEELKSYLFKSLLSVIIFVWLFIGLFSFQWVGFLGYLIFNIFVVTPISRIGGIGSTNYIIIHWINSLIGFLFCIFVIVNHYHLRIDLTEVFLSIIR